jgi:menaquinone-dependent protoporphyrinogen IX oxidase
MSGIIIYKGKYGATAQYAHWLADDLDLPISRATFENQQILDYCQYVILGTSVYVGKLQLAKWIKQHQSMLAKKKIFLFIVCATPASEVQKLDAILKKNIPPELLRNSEVFFLRGRMKKQDLSAFDRFVLKMGASLVKDPDERRNMLTDFDEVRKKNLEDLKRAIRKYNGGIHSFGPAEECFRAESDTMLIS